MINKYGGVAEFTSARLLYNDLAAVARSHPREPALREAQSMSAFNLVTCLARKGNIAEARAIYDQLRTLIRKYPEEPLAEFLAKSAVNLIERLIKDNDLLGLVVIYKQLNAIGNRFADTPWFRDASAKAAWHLIKIRCNARKLVEANAAYTDLAALARAHPDEPALRPCGGRGER